QTYRRKLSVSIPGWLRSGRYRLTGKIFQSGKLISENHDHIFIASADMHEATRPAATNVLLYDPQGQTKRAFQRLNIPFTPVSDVNRLPAASLLVVGANGADNNLLTDSAALNESVRAGGGLLLLRQDSLSFLTLNGVLD